MAKGTQVTENGPFMHITTEEGQLEILERDRESSSGAAMEADFEERHEEGETMLDINCDEIGMEKETGINGGGEMHNNPNHKLSIEPMAGNGVVVDAAEQPIIIAANTFGPHGRDASLFRGEMDCLKERVGQLEQQMENLLWDVRSSITCQV